MAFGLADASVSRTAVRHDLLWWTFDEDGSQGQGSVIFHFAGLPLAVRADLNYNGFTFKKDLPFSSGETGGSVTPTGDITQQILAGSRMCRSRSTWARSLLISPLASQGSTSRPTWPMLYPREQDESATKFAVSGGVGLSMKRLGASAFIEAKLNNIYTDGKFIGEKELKSLQFVPVTFGFVF